MLVSVVQVTHNAALDGKHQVVLDKYRHLSQLLLLHCQYRNPEIPE